MSCERNVRRCSLRVGGGGVPFIFALVAVGVIKEVCVAVCGVGKFLHVCHTYLSCSGNAL